MSCFSKLLVTGALVLAPLTPVSAATLLDQINDPINFHYWTDASIFGYMGQTFTVGKAGTLTDISVDLGKQNSPPAAIFYLTPIISNQILFSKASVVAVSPSLISPIYYGSGPAFSDWVSLDFTPYDITVAPGDLYALFFSAPIIPDTSSTANRIGWFGSDNTYSGGTAVYSPFLSDQVYDPSRSYPSIDMGFATYVSSAVPEPSTWGLMIAGLGFLGCLLRRKPKTKSA